MINTASRTTVAELVDNQLISAIVDIVYTNLLDDFRINRYFYSRPLAVQASALKELLMAVLDKTGFNAKHVSELSDAFFTAAFARGNAKPSMVNNRDFAFLEMFVTGDIIGGETVSRLILLSPAHSHLIRLQPNDDNYDVVLEHLATALKQLKVADTIAEQILSFAESGRDGVLGRGKEIYNEDNVSSHYRAHG